MPLFDSPSPPRRITVPDDARAAAALSRLVEEDRDVFTPDVDDRLLDVIARANDPRDAFELRDLWLGRVEYELGDDALRPELAELWRRSRPRRRVTPEEALTSRSTVRFVKELFNWFFRDDLYGELAGDRQLVLSSGSVDEEHWGLPAVLKDCVRFALDRDWYGYSDSRGRIPARQAVAAYENALMERDVYDERNVAITLGGTFTVSTLADFLLTGRSASAEPVLCGIPNYPPLVEAVARRNEVRMVPMPSAAGKVSLEPLIRALTPNTPMVLIQTAINPTGALVDEDELARLIHAAGPNTTVMLDECHEWLGPHRPRSAARAARNVVRVSSLSKNWSAPGMKVGWLLADREFIDEYYEHASTMFGGPPSFLYTVIEVLARMERWLVAGLDRPGAAEVAEFEPSYGIGADRLRAAYASYVQERLQRQDALATLRAAACHRLSHVAEVTVPAYSINAAVRFPGWDDSYRCFRDLLRETGVSTYPGILNFCFSGGVVRMTTARPWDDLVEAGDRLTNALLGAKAGRA
ncbi:aminotransferase class I/II-fold pyridoxal phosphate-dependent enzyme [Streptomyces sp. TG1A-8]|uniref:pyridoxal phosphate-dependent aminotransferase n=1 Tax=Streptomyces sp. TG1A-8 TaxID=3051385 RepID=UPI00265BE086|nr:aminotransferase class I/II-fold pyridoxal phosphate-dependent enzyme [Streptomyces sp. TG1A-8]MDO0924958.1 aminotransferase class I/II-fold pyridoxal phosphate-dependent enzyme [Streptomyces sp. TG1A-8]